MKSSFKRDELSSDCRDYTLIVKKLPWKQCNRVEQHAVSEYKANSYALIFISLMAVGHRHALVIGLF